MKPRAVDLFCGAGGATRGLQLAGFHVFGVDIRPQPRYCGDVFWQEDALALPIEFFHQFDFIWASPPCQAYTPLKALHVGRNYPDHVAATRALLRASGVPYAIENVPGSPVSAMVILCGTMFGLRSYRHRHFETSWFVWQPEHPRHEVPTFSQAGQHNRKARFLAGSFATVTGNVGTYCGPLAMGIDWMNGDELSQAIPPAYSEFIGKAALSYIRQDRAAVPTARRPVRGVDVNPPRSSTPHPIQIAVGPTPCGNKSEATLNRQGYRRGLASLSDEG